MKKNYRNKERKLIGISKRISVLLFYLVLCIGTVMGALFFLRPDTSNFEKRTLTAFPKFTISSFLDGSYFSDISLWYADTFPNRDSFMEFNSKLASLNGPKMETEVISTAKADKIGEKSKEKKKEPAQLPDTHALQEEVQNQITAGLLVHDGAAYGGYYFNQAACDKYVNVLNRAADELDGTTKVYSLLVPNNSGVMLDKETRDKLGGTDQEQTIEYYYDNYDKVIPVRFMSDLQKNNDKQLFFKTDHHWTQDGAYYAYKAFCKEKGIKPNKLKSYETKTFEPFWGSYTQEVGKEKLTPDTLKAYLPKATNEMYVYSNSIPSAEELSSGELNPTYTGSVVVTSDTLDEYNQYMRYIEGDNGFKVIDNPKINDGSSCLLVKESYGNCFAPFLVDHYDKVYIADFRYCDIDVVSFCKENKVDDLLLMNNIQLIANEGVANWYDALLV